MEALLNKSTHTGHDGQSWLVGLLFTYFLFTILPGEPTSPVGYYSGYTVALFCLSILSLHFLSSGSSITANKTPFLLILAIVSSYLLSGSYHFLAGELSMVNTLEMVLISFFTLVNIFIIPRYLNLHLIAWILSSIAAVSVLSGIPSLVVGEYTLFGFQYIPYGQADLFPVVDGLNAYFQHINPMNRLTVYGFFSALFLLLYSNSKLSSIALAINGIGVILSSRRQTILLIVLLLPVAAAYWYNAQWTRDRIPQYLCLTLIGGFVSLFVFIITQLPIPIVNINIRLEIWKQMWRTIINNPIFGIGPRSPFPFSPHNGFLLSGVTSGVVGLVSYTSLPIILIRHTYHSVSTENLYILMILYSSFIFQFFEVYNFVGINFDSTVVAVFIGMLILKHTEE